MSLRDQIRSRARQNVESGVASVARGAEERQARFAAGRVEGLPRLRHDQIVPDPGQIRRDFDAESIERLARSIERVGMEDPVKVYPADGGRFMLREGERRWRAVGWLIEQGRVAPDAEFIPVLVEPRPGSGAEETARLRVRQLVTSVNKKLFHPLEEMEAVLEIAGLEIAGLEGYGLEGGLPATEVAARHGLDERMVRDQLRVGRAFEPAERDVLRAGAPGLPFETLAALAEWLREQTRHGMEEAARREAVARVAKRRPTAKTVELLLRDLAVRKSAGRPRAPLKRSARTLRDGSYQVSLAIASDRATDPATLRDAAGYLRGVVEELERRAARADGEG